METNGTKKKNIKVQMKFSFFSFNILEHTYWSSISLKLIDKRQKKKKYSPWADFVNRVALMLLAFKTIDHDILTSLYAWLVIFNVLPCVLYIVLVLSNICRAEALLSMAIAVVIDRKFPDLRLKCHWGFCTWTQCSVDNTTTIWRQHKQKVIRL